MALWWQEMQRCHAKNRRPFCGITPAGNTELTGLNGGLQLERRLAQVSCTNVTHAWFAETYINIFFW